MAGFDVSAATYDQEFTESKIGQFQRQQVMNQFVKCLIKPRLKILEINCGTGEDAIWLANKGHLVTATDLSEKMLDVARKKIMNNDLLDRVTIQKVDIKSLNEADLNDEYDLIFSNFGGLNCISPLEFRKFAKAAFELLNPSGKLVIVLMPDYTLWDNIYLLWKWRWKDLFRRAGQQPKLVNIHNEEVPTWYYSNDQLIRILKNYYILSKSRSIGLFVPPSFLDQYFTRFPNLLLFLHKMDRLFSSFSIFARFADHMYLEFVKKA